MKKRLSVIILNFNTRELLRGCLASLPTNSDYEIVVVDNASTDGSMAMVKAGFPMVTLIANKINLGFGPANNAAAKKAKGDYVVFLNADMKLEKETLSFPLDYISSHPDVGAVTAKTVLGDGSLDATCHRGFPTPWSAFCYFSGLAKIFPHSRLFAGYTMGYLDPDTAHEVEAINGAYFMMPRILGNRLDWFDKDFFWKGEDLDLCYRIRQAGYKIMYLPQVKIWHFKGSSGGHRPGSKTLKARFEVMRIFYRKHYTNKYPHWVKTLVFLGIDLREFLANLSL
ncbi:MAG: glycosyltransferase family 2 protein [Patescibacteria group bacterium]|nr:glycosyltransferase family 2 protein [Patescibacteria group bacterium]MCL5431705.1 glycosyltransferase family 2 protein [Patescibacteria group bacterium]